MLTEEQEKELRSELVQAQQRVKEMEQAVEAYSTGEKNALARAEAAEAGAVGVAVARDDARAHIAALEESIGKEREGWQKSINTLAVAGRKLVEHTATLKKHDKELVADSMLVFGMTEPVDALEGNS